MDLSDERRRLLERLIRQGAPAANDRPADAARHIPVGVAPTTAPDVTTRTEPVSYAQRRLWFLEQLQQTEVPYTLHAVEHLHVAIDPARLERAINEIVRRHEVLRTTFTLQDDEPVQRIASELSVPLRTVDLAALPEAERRSEALRQMGHTAARRFDLATGPLLRTELYRLSPQEYYFFFAVHHIVFDGPSFPIFFAELRAIYGALVENRPHGLPRPATQYSDSVNEQRTRLTPQRIADEVAFWRTELAGTPLLSLPTDRRREAVPTFRGGSAPVVIPAPLVGRLRQRGAAGQTTLFTVLLAGLWAGLSRVCGQDDFAVGLPVTGRESTEREHTIGFFVDTVVVRANLQDDPSTGELIRRAHAALQRSLSHRALPFEMLVEHLRPDRDLSVNPFFQVGFQLMMQPAVAAGSGGADIARSSAMFDLGMDLWLQGDAVEGRLQFNTDLFDPPTIELVLAAFDSALEWLSGPDRRFGEFAIGPMSRESVTPSILAGAAAGFPESTCIDLIAEVARRAPHMTALHGEQSAMTYAQLMDRSERLAGALAARGARPGALIALDLRRSIELTTMQIATWRAGCAFVCVDPGWPQQRREEILRAAQPHLVIDGAALMALDEQPRSAARLQPTDRSDLAFVIFTSGSSGRPKGVLIEHGGLLNVAHAQRSAFGLAPGRRVAQLASMAFDASIFETVMALCSGATLVAGPPETLAGTDLAAFLARHEVDTVVMPPSLLATMEPAACEAVRLVCVAGEKCPNDLARRWQGGRDFYNLYGPAEASIWATYSRIHAGSQVSIGRPIPNTATMVVDSALRIVPVGVAGELCLAGIGITRGYLHDAERTNERFVPTLSGGHGRMYRTGDLVRQTRSGELVFLGRLDRQVKVRGVRIEPEEIEGLLRTIPLVRAAVVAARAVDDDELALVAYVQCANQPEATIDACRRLARERLPQHLVPSHFVAVDEWPRTASGKIDERALPVPTSGSRPGHGYVEPATPTQQRVAALMARAARVARVGAEDDFFRIGGHSLAAAQLVARVRELFAADISIRDVFLHSTLAAFSARIDALVAERNGVPEFDEVPLVRLPRRHQSREHT